MTPTPPNRDTAQDTGSLYRSDGWNVYQRETLIATCHTGHQGQLASDIAARIADLLNRDFRQFCINVCKSAESSNV